VRGERKRSCCIHVDGGGQQGSSVPHAERGHSQLTDVVTSKESQKQRVHTEGRQTCSSPEIHKTESTLLECGAGLNLTSLSLVISPVEKK